MRRAIFFIAVVMFGGGVPVAAAQAPEPAAKRPASGKPQGTAEKEKAVEPQLPFVVQLLETQVRFEANGDSRKEVHTIVKIVNVLGAQQFARISFDYNRSFQKIEIPLVRVSHANGGISEVLPSAVTDVANPAVQQFPVYQDVRVKAVRILGLQEGETVEYRVITTTTKPPMAPNFWLEHSFDRSGQVLEEHYEVDLPVARKLDMRISPDTPAATKETAGSGENAFTIYKWRRTYAPGEPASIPEGSGVADVGVSTLNWERLSARLAELLLPGAKPLAEITGRDEVAKEMARRPEVGAAVKEKALALTKGLNSDVEKLKAVYQFVATQINTVDLPLGSTGFRARTAADILNSGYAIGEDKYVLLAAMAAGNGMRADAVLTGYCDKNALAVPTAFKHLVAIGSTKDREYWMDPAIEVAPFGMIAPSDAKCALELRRDAATLNAAGQEWVNTPSAPPFAAFQKVSVDAEISDSGQLAAKVKYVLRGENELLLRVAFHQAPKEKWKDVATLLAISDGFRGQVTSAKASDPMATEDPFTVEYELTQLKFVDWSKKPVRIPALLPQIGLPELPLAQGKMAPKIELGVPLDVQTAMTLKLPDGTTVQTPAGTSVARDYATYSSKYSSSGNTVVASRSINFLKREIGGERAAEYNAFLRSVQNDQAQRFVLVPGEKLENAPKAPSK